MVGSPLRDAAVDPKPWDFLPPTNAGEADPHGPLVVAPGIHGVGPKPIRGGEVFVDNPRSRRRPSGPRRGGSRRGQARHGEHRAEGIEEVAPSLPAAASRWWPGREPAGVRHAMTERATPTARNQSNTPKRTARLDVQTHLDSAGGELGGGSYWRSVIRPPSPPSDSCRDRRIPGQSRRHLQEDDACLIGAASALVAGNVFAASDADLPTSVAGSTPSSRPEGGGPGWRLPTSSYDEYFASLRPISLYWRLGSRAACGVRR